MPLPLPNLDTRRWDDLVEEGRALIPRYAPGWTDHNIHDPGITLIELLAWLTESDIYRVNQIPARHRLKFLSLIGFTPQPPRAAQGFVTYMPEAGTASFLVPAGVELEATDTGKRSLQFRTLRDLTVSVVELAAIQVDAGDGIIVDKTRDWRDGLAILPLGADPQPGAALYLGFGTLPTETPVALYFHAGTAESGAAERARIMREEAAQRESCRQVLPDIIYPGVDSPPQAATESSPHHSARLAWEAFTGDTAAPWSRLELVEGLARPLVGQVMDDSRSLTLDGIIEINLPQAIAETDLGKAGDEPRFYLRCRLEDGGYDAPPQLAMIAANSVVVEQSLPVWQGFKIAADVTPSGTAPAPGTPARFNLDLNSSGVISALEFFEPAQAPDHPGVMVISYDEPDGVKDGQITLEMVLAGIGDGRPDQRVMLPKAPVLVESLILFTQSGGSWHQWTRRDDLDASARTDFHFVVDSMSGEIAGGDGERGRVFPHGALILASYKWTRAAMGNVAARSITRAADSPRNALWLSGLSDQVKDQLSQITTNPLAASGGGAAEDLLTAAGRAVATLHAHERLIDLATAFKSSTLDQIARPAVRALSAPVRAVNLLDIERQALDVPGTRIARARAWAATHPDYPCLEAPGVVTLVVMPDLPVAKPEPSRGLLQAVKRYLDCRRTICTRIEVVGPKFLQVRVRSRVQARPHASTERVRADIVRALDSFLDPRRGGPGGLGWPFGRDVYRSEILHVIDTVPGVDHVLELSLSAGGAEPQCGNLQVCATWLVTPGEHQIEVV